MHARTHARTCVFRVSLELFKASDVMTRDPLLVHVHSSVSHVARLPLQCNHGGFPVVVQPDRLHPDKHTFFGFINRLVRNDDVLYYVLESVLMCMTACTCIL